MRILALAAALSLPAMAFAVPTVPVTNPESPKARMAPAASATAGATTLIAQGADGARAVVCGAAVVTGVLGARLEADCTDDDEAPVRIRLLEGGFHLHVGGTPMTVDLDGAQLEARSAELIAAKLKGSWIVQVRLLGDSGAVLARQPTPPPAAPSVEAELPPTDEPAAEPAEATPPAPLPPVPLASGTRYAVVPGEPPREASRRGRLFLGKMLSRLLPETERAQTRGTRLVARDVEHPADFAANAAAAAALMGDVEIEDIEVEVGCVEICVD
jgi:hypothetical protein